MGSKHQNGRRYNRGEIIVIKNGYIKEYRGELQILLGRAGEVVIFDAGAEEDEGEIFTAGWIDKLENESELILTSLKISDVEDLG